MSSHTKHYYRLYYGKLQYCWQILYITIVLRQCFWWIMWLDINVRKMVKWSLFDSLTCNLILLPQQSCLEIQPVNLEIEIYGPMWCHNLYLHTETFTVNICYNTNSNIQTFQGQWNVPLYLLFLSKSCTWNTPSGLIVIFELIINRKGFLD